MTPNPDILAVMAEVEQAAEKATPRPWEPRFIYRSLHAVRTNKDWLKLLPNPDDRDWEDAELIALAANHAPDISAFARRLLEVARATKQLRSSINVGSTLLAIDSLLVRLERDYPGCLRKEGEPDARQ